MQGKNRPSATQNIARLSRRRIDSITGSFRRARYQSRQRSNDAFTRLRRGPFVGRSTLHTSPPVLASEAAPASSPLETRELVPAGVDSSTLPTLALMGTAPRPASGFNLPEENPPYISFLTGQPMDEHYDEHYIEEDEAGIAAADSGRPVAEQTTVPVPTYDPNRRSTRNFLSLMGRSERNPRRFTFKIRNRRLFFVVALLSLLALVGLVLGLLYLGRFFQTATSQSFAVDFVPFGSGSTYAVNSEGTQVSKDLSNNFKSAAGVPGLEVRLADSVIKGGEVSAAESELKRTDGDIVVWGTQDPTSKKLNLSLLLKPNGPFDVPDGMGFKENQRRLFDPDLLAFVTDPPAANSKPGDRQPLTVLLSGLYNYYSGGYEQAVADFTVLSRNNDPNLPAMRLLRGNALFAFGKYSQAQDEYDRLLALINDNLQRGSQPPIDPAYVYNNRGMALMYQPGKVDEAIASFNEAIRRRGDLSRPRINLVAAQQDRPGASPTDAELNLRLKTLDEAIKVDPNLPTAYYYRGRVYDALRDNDKAIVAYQQASKLDANIPAYYRELGWAYIESGKDDKVESARATFDSGFNLAQRQQQSSRDQALRYTSQNLTELGRVWQLRGQALEAVQNDLKYGLARSAFEKGRREGNKVGNPFDKAVRWAQSKKTALEDARDRLLEVIGARPEFGEPHLYLGMTYELLGEGDASSEYGKAKQLEKDPTRLLRFSQALADFYIGRKDYNRAIAEYSDFLKTRPNTWQAQLGLAKIYLDPSLSQFDKALKPAQKAAELKPDNAEAQITVGKVLLGLKRYDQALPYFDKALQIKPDYTEARVRRADALNGLGRKDEAARDYETAIKQNDAFPEARYSLGMIYQNQDGAKARTELETAVKQDPNLASAHYQLGLIYSQNDTTIDKAITSYGEAIRVVESEIKVNPQAYRVPAFYPSAYYLRGLLYESKGQLENAERDYAQALTIEPGLFNARYHRALVLVRLGRLEDALKEGQFAVQQNRSSAEAQSALGDVYRLSADHNKAVTAYTEALRLRVNYTVALYGRAVSYYQLQKYDVGLIDVQKLISLDQKFPGALVLQAQYQNQRSDYASAMKSLDLARQIYPNDPDLFTTQGITYMRSNQAAKAFEAFNRAVQIDNAQVEAHFWLGALYNGQLQHDKAITEYEKTVQLRPDWSLAWRYLGEQYAASGKPDTAIEKFTKAIEKDKTQIEAFYQRGNAYRATNQRAKAQADYDAALGLNAKYAPALFQKATTYEEVGDTPNAKKYYRLAADNAQPSESGIKEDALRSLTRLG